MFTRISSREQEVLELIAYEHNSKEIAQQLFISEHTVISHRKNLISKLDVRNTAGLVRRAFEIGLLKVNVNPAISMLSLIILMLPISIMAQVKILQQPGFQWHEPSAWSPIGVPTANDSVIISGDTFIMPDSIARARFVQINDGLGQLEIQRDVINNKRGQLFIADSNGNGVVNHGVLEIGGRLKIERSRETALINTGSLEIWDRAPISKTP